MKSNSNFFGSKLFLLLVISLSLTSSGYAQKKLTISGYIKEKATGESLIGATVFVKEVNKGASANEYGFYSLSLNPGQYFLVVSYVGFKTQIIRVDLTKDYRLNLEMEPGAITQKEITVSARKADENTKDAAMGRVDLDIEQIKSLPALFGEVDVLRIIQLLPGVKTSGEGSTGFYVRGGGPDQNLILLDEAVVYNASHLFGFFSVFNADAINGTTLIKGGMPAQYGGRASSVLNITMKEGNMKEHTFEGGVGLIASRLTAQGPIVKDKSSYIISGRRTYIDALTAPFIPSTNNFSGSGYYFYDLNAKVNYKFSDKDRLFLSGYFGRDVFNFANKENGFNINIPWGNATGTLRWNHLFSNKLFMNATAIYSNYQFSSNIKQTIFEFNFDSGIENFGTKVDFDYFASVRHQIKFGAQHTYHIFTPSTSSARTGENTFSQALDKLRAHEYAAYVNHTWDVNDKIQLNSGLRVSGFSQVGPYTQLQVNARNEFDTIKKFGTNEPVTNYWGLEPRFTLRYQLNSASSIKASVTRNMQYIHLASNSGNSLPTDVWVPSTLRVKPQIAIQYALGYFRNFKENTYEASVEVYYKDLQNQIDFRDNYTPQLNRPAEMDFVFGRGWAYGAEFFLKKRTGKFTGWIGYTLSWAMRQFPDIMGGKVFPYRFDRRHDLSVVAAYELSKKWSFAGTFVYGTGLAFTLPTGRAFIEGQIVDLYADRNAFRLAPYHRMDLAATYVPNPDSKKKFKSSWTFALYNVYSRLNPYFVYFETAGSPATNDLRLQAKQVSLFPIVPSVTWNFKF